MKKLLLIFLVIIMIFSATACKGAAQGEGDKDSMQNGSAQTQNTNVEIKYNGGTSEERTLVNTYKKLTEEKKLHIAYIGGSVTNGYGGTMPWRTLTTNWFKETYTDAAVTETNAGIGGTSSMLGLARLEKDVLTHNPDLVFIEFAGNDRDLGFTEMQSAAFVDAMVRKIHKSNPETDIVFVFITEQSQMDAEYANIKGHRKVAEYYGIPCVDAGKSVVQKMKETGNDWSYYFGDSIHPNDNGYKAYGEEVIKVIKEKIEKGKSAAAAPHKISDTPATTNTPVLFRMVEADEFTYDENWYYREKAKMSASNKSELAARKSGGVMTFEFEGSVIGLLYNSKNNAEIKVTIDGGEEKAFKFGETPACRERVIATNLSNGTHTVKIEYVGPGYFAISALLVG